MFSKKAKVLISTAVLTSLGVAVTSVASARFSGEARGQNAVAAVTRPTHDNGVQGKESDRDGRHRGKFGAHLDAAATALGMTSEELKTALKSGSTLAEVAASKNVALQKVIDAVVADEKAEIAQAVTDGKLTQVQADALLAKVTEHVTAIVNGERPAPLFGHGRDGGPHGDHGRGHRHGRRGLAHHDEAEESSDA